MPRYDKFWDRISKNYAKAPLSDPVAYEQKLKITQGYLSPETELMEFGCGTGSTAIRHAPFVKHILATDFSKEMIRIAKEKAKKSNINNITFEQSSIDDMDVPAQSFDVVMGMSILHLLKDEKATIRKVHQLLKPGGLFISSTFCLGDNMRFIKYIAPIGQFFGMLPLINVFTRDELVESLKSAGFEIEHEWLPGKKKAVFIVAKKAG